MPRYPEFILAHLAVADAAHQRRVLPHNAVEQKHLPAMGNARFDARLVDEARVEIYSLEVEEQTAGIENDSGVLGLIIRRRARFRFRPAFRHRATPGSFRELPVRRS